MKRLLIFMFFPELKIMARLEFEVQFLTLRQSREHRFTRRTNSLAQTVIYFKESKLKKKNKIPTPRNPLFKIGARLKLKGGHKFEIIRFIYSRPS